MESPSTYLVRKLFRGQRSCELPKSCAVHIRRKRNHFFTLKIISECLAEVNTAVWCGPLGLFELNPFQTGTASVAKEISNLTKKNSLISIAGGGDTVAALSQSNYNKDFTYISTAGGAFLELLAGENLPGIEVLK